MSDSTQTPDLVRYASDAGVATITMDHPATRNALSDAMLDGLIGAVERARDDDSVRCVVLASSQAAGPGRQEARPDAADRGARHVPTNPRGGPAPASLRPRARTRRACSRRLAPIQCVDRFSGGDSVRMCHGPRPQRVGGNPVLLELGGMFCTAAVAILGGDDMMAKARTPEIMADAARAIISRPPAEHTGEQLIDEAVLEGVDLCQYGPADAMSDLFVD